MTPDDITEKGPRSPTAREVLNELKWREDRDFGLVKVYIIHRGNPGDSKLLVGDEIHGLDQLFFQTEETSIPFHRIYKITYDEETVYTRDIPGFVPPDERDVVGSDHDHDWDPLDNYM